jgi:hypothetical protein
MGDQDLPMIFTNKAGKESLVRKERKMKETKYYISYFSKSDGKKIKRPYDPHSEKQHEFIAGSGNLCKRYWDASKEGLRTANAPWTITIKKEKYDRQ